MKKLYFQSYYNHKRHIFLYYLNYLEKLFVHLSYCNLQKHILLLKLILLEKKLVLLYFYIERMHSYVYF